MTENYLSVDCGTCEMIHTTTCKDCLVTYICDREPNEAVVISMDEWRSIRSLTGAGLLPDLQHKEFRNSVK
ncbi:MAG: hypothetical protein P8J01_05500 [Acidimicrobiales bacterium]|nr:hypothetical protein [Acidimicrobiales bacterium]